MTFTLKTTGRTINAVADDGSIIASWTKKTTRTERPFSGSYNIHRIAKGDTFIETDDFTFSGDHETALAAVKAGMPKSFVDAKWGSFMKDEWDVYNFLEGFIGGCAWFGNTPKNIVAAVKKSQRAGFQFNV